MTRAWMVLGLICAMGTSAVAQTESADAPLEAAQAPVADTTAAEATPVAEAAAEVTPAVAASTPAPPDDPRLVEARERIARAEALYEQENYDAALAEFERTRELLEGHNMRFRVLYNIGRCQEKLFQYREAMESYRSFLSDGGGFSDQAADVRAKIDLLDGLLGTVTFSVSVTGYEVWVGDRLIATDINELLLPSGTHAIEIRKEGFVANQQQAQVVARREVVLSFELERLAEEFEGLSPALFWTATGTAVVALAVGATFGGLAMSRSGVINERNPSLATRDEVDEINRLTLTADVMFGVALLGATTAVVFALFTDWGGEEEGATLRIDPAIAPHQAGVVARGSF